MKARLLIPALLTVLSFITLAMENRASPAKVPAPEILGVRLGMPYATAHAQLGKLGQLKTADEGQEVWTLLGNEHYQFLIVGYDSERQVRYITALVNDGGTPLGYQDVGDVKSAARTGQSNLTFTWKGRDPKARFEYLAIAKGKDPQRLSSFSVKRAGARGEEKD